MKKVKRAAAIIAALMAVNSVTMVWAAETGTKGQGTFEGNVSLNIVNVELPTINEDSNGFASELTFIIDPNDLIGKSNKARYSNADFDTDSKKGFYFKNADGKYTAKSDELTATNKSSTKIDVTLQATLINYTGITLLDGDSTADDVFGSAKTPSICINLKSGEKSSAITEESSAELKDRIDAADDDAFVLLYEEGTGYRYSQSSLVSEDSFKNYTFWFTGASNMNGDWEAISDDVAPELDLVWRFDPYLGDAEPRIAHEDICFSREGESQLDLDLGTGDYAATTYTNISLSDTGNAMADALDIITEGYVRLDLEYGYVLKFSPDLAERLHGAGVTSGKINITFNNTMNREGEGATTSSVPFTVN